MFSGFMRSKIHLATNPGMVIHTDVAEMVVSSLGREKFFVTFIDEANGHLRIAHCRTEGEAVYYLKSHVRWSERQTDREVKLIVLDGGKEYLTGAETLEAEGIEIDRSALQTAGKWATGRMNCTIKSALRTILINAGAPPNFWAECLYTVVVIRNRIPRVTKRIMLEDEMTGIKPTVTHLLTFGCKVWVRIPDKIGKGMEPKAEKAVRLRCLSYGEHLFMLEDKQTVQVSRNCKIIETKFRMCAWNEIVRVTRNCIEKEQQGDGDDVLVQYLVVTDEPDDNIGDAELRMVVERHDAEAGQITDVTIQECRNTSDGDGISDASNEIYGGERKILGEILQMSREKQRRQQKHQVEEAQLVQKSKRNDLEIGQ